MKKRVLYFLLNLLCVSFVYSQPVAAPSVRCISVSLSGNITINWITPPDPSGLFTRYEIWTSSTNTGPYTLAGNVNVYSQTSFTHNSGLGNIQAQYYYMVTVSSSTFMSLPSDTLSSVFLNLNDINGKINLTWNATHTPLLPSASPTYTLSREYPASVWTVLYTGPNQQFIDTITLCSIYYNYKIETSDASGCTSLSNVNGGLFHDLTPPEIPLLDSISLNSSGQAVLGWEVSVSNDVIGYVIFNKNTGVWIPIDTVFGYNNTTYTNLGSIAGTQSENYFIAAIDSCKNISGPGLDQKTIFVTSSYDLCSRTVNLSWTPYSNLPLGVLRYDVYCSINSGNYNLVGSSPSNTFAHPSLNPGYTYCYTIKVRNSNLSISANSNQTCMLALAPQGPAFVYIRSVSVNLKKQVEITYTVDTTKPFKGVTIFKSTDGINFSTLSFNTSSTNSVQTFVDVDVKATEQTYYYKVQLTDSCGNPGSYSNTSKTIVLKVSNDNANIFYNTLTWDAYSSWSGNVNSYNVYRAVNGIFDPAPIGNVGFANRIYVDNVEEFVSDNGKFSYYVEAVEDTGNIYGFMDRATSNPADAYVEVSVFVPNAFSPNGLNNIWLPVSQYVDKSDYKVMVLNRWGDKVFETTNDREGWNGHNATDDVYIYLIDYKNSRGEYVQLKGHLNVVR